MTTTTTNYTLVMPCVPVTNLGYDCPVGWEPVGYTQPGSCIIGNPPGDFGEDAWRQLGHNHVCKKKIQTSGNVELDCCANIDGVASSIECQSRGLVPYGQTCNLVMKDHCVSRNNQDSLQHNWQGVPLGQNASVYNPCSGVLTTKQGQQFNGRHDKYCDEYLRKAPSHNYFSTHDFNDYPHDFPRYSYTTPQFDGTFGYQPTRKPYYPYNDYKDKNQNTYCAFYPNQCIHQNQ